MQQMTNDVERVKDRSYCLVSLNKPKKYPLLVVLLKMGGLRGRDFFRVFVSVLRIPDRRHHAVKLADVYGRGGRCWRCGDGEGILLLL